MKYINETELAEGLRHLGLQKGDTVLVHSSLFALGLLEGFKPAEQAEAYLNVLRNSIGDDGTLIAPAFNFDFCKGKTFHRQNTPSSGMGVLSEAIRTAKDAERSKHPMQSISVLGRHSRWITEPDTESSFSPEGPFHRFIELNGKLLFLGSTIQAAALIHWVEERLSVPYRFWKSFTGEYIDEEEGIHEERTYNMFVRDLKINPLLHLHPIENRLTEQSQMIVTKLGMGAMKLTDAEDFIRVAQNLLENDPYSLLENIEEVKEKMNLMDCDD